ncbi:hypothetical protein PISL3812_05299 [Talaromyces islandicus]|uniref:ASST-domain-containing protein n=1 Tax=Talaromyces islandicus TaxID=28573 RepID=A0A0U1LZV5_TALIS|nr:hypothetical protein PISL3812_05299 [Talaromyces islandicus]
MTVLSRLAVLGALAAPFSQAASELCSADSREIVQNTTEYWPYQVYETTDVTPPYMDITTSGEPLADGLIFFGQNIRPGTHTIHQQRPLIMTDTNDLVWAGPMTVGVMTTDLKTATMNGSPVLIYWSSIGKQPIEGIGYGQVHILDDTYQEIATVCPQLNLTLTPGATSQCDADLHEHYLTPSNTMLVTAYNVTQADLTPLGGKSDDWVLDALAVEVDIETGDILFVWSSLEHIPVNNTKMSYPAQGTTQDSPLDLYHMNSIQSVGDNYLINCRHTWSTYMVNKDGDILWTIQGHTGGDFGSLPENGTYSWGHHTRFTQLSDTTAFLSLFANDNNIPAINVTAKGITLRLTLPPDPSNPPELVTNLWDVNDETYSWAEGSLSQLDNGNYFMGYGIRAVMKEYGPNPTSEGDVRWSAHFADFNSGHSYRAFKQVWHATPASQPALVVSKSDVPDSLSNCTGSSSSSAFGYVSWNGATDVTSYVVYGGASNDSLEEIGTISKNGFETVFALPDNVSAVQVGAVEGSKVVQRSEVVTV